jgi:hypothetical protein
MGSMTLIIILASVLLPIVLVVVIMGSLMKGQKQVDELLRTGMPARGRILQLGTTGGSVAVMGHRHLKLILTVEVHPQMGAPYQASFEQLISELQLPSVQPGAEIDLRIDPRNPARMAMAGVGSGPMGQPQQAWGQQQPGYRAPPVMGPAPVAVMTPQYKSAMPMILIMLFVTTVPTAAILLYVFVDFSTMFGSSSSDEDEEKSEASDEDGSEKKKSKKKKGVCAQAAACCKVVGGGAAASACDNFDDGMPVEGCRQALDGYKKAAKAMNKSCD